MYVTVAAQLTNGHFAVVEVDVDYDCVDVPPIVVCDDGHEVALTDADYEAIKAEAVNEWLYCRGRA